MPITAADSLAGFSLPTRAWFSDAFASPTEAQQLAWASILADQHTLLVAPTGSGKTLAAFLTSIDRLASRTPAQVAEARNAGHVSVVYVSPLKALANDVQRNLTAPLRGIQLAAQRLGAASPDISVAIRSGDSTAQERRALVAHPPDILITTPESLFLLLSSTHTAMFSAVTTIIVDEIHALAGTKRGAHLQLSLERLAQLRAGHVREGKTFGGKTLGGQTFEQPLQRIGLSATVQPPERVARFLAGTSPVDIAISSSEKQWDLRVEVPVEDMTNLALEPDPDTGEAPPNQSIWPFLEQRVLELIDQHRTTLCFVNSRRVAERLTARLNELHAQRLGAEVDEKESGPPAAIMAQSPSTVALDGEWPVIARAHHGSVSKERRASIEAALKAGDLPCVVATSSLELGIDMGSIDLVIQVGAPPSVSSGLQRVGRAGHQVGAVSRAVVLPTHRGDLLQAAVVTREMLSGNLEAVHELANPLDVLAQHLVSMVIDHSRTSAELFTVVRRASSFAQLPRSIFDGVLDMLSGRYPSEEFAELRPRVTWDRTSDLVAARPGARRLVTTSGGTIPDRGLFGVFLAGSAETDNSEGTPTRQPAGRRVGELDEEMVHESRVGDVFTLGTSSWRIEDITPHQVLVSPAAGRAGRLPFWKGDSAARPAMLGRSIGEATGRLHHDQDAGLSGLDENAWTNLRAHIREQAESTATVPSDSTVVLERFRDELGDWRLVVHCPLGAAVLTPWALAIEAAARERFGDEVRAWASNDGIVISVPDLDEAPGAELLPTDAESVRQWVTDEVFGSALFAARFRESAARALLLPRRDPGRRTPLWRQRQRAAQLLQVASRHRDFPIILETMRECLEDVFDLASLTELLDGLASRRIHLVVSDTERPSPFARSLLFGYVGEFLYDADQPLAERRLAALSVDQGLLAELLGRDGAHPLLDPAAATLVEADLQRLAEGARATTAEALWDVVRTLGPLTPVEAIARTNQDAEVAQEWIEHLVSQRRLARPRLGGTEVLVVGDDLGLLRDALGVPAPPGYVEPAPMPPAQAMDRLVLRQLLHRCGLDGAELAARWSLPPADISESLTRLATDVDLVEVDGAWWHPDVLERVRRRTLALLRSEVEPVDPAQLARFALQWHELDQPDRGPEALLRAVDALAGIPIPASMLESIVLPARVADYEPHLLDQALGAGEVIWTGHGAISNTDGWVQLWPADLVLVRGDTPDEASSGLYARLAEGGAWTLAELTTAAHGGPATASRGGLATPADVDALWQLVWAGLATSSSFQAVRELTHQQRGGAPALRTPRAARTHRRVLPRPPRHASGPTVSGRWSATPLAGDDQHTRLLSLTTALHRHGVLVRGMLTSEPDWPSFSAAYPLLAAMEDQGSVRRGHFVAGLGGAQFALPGAVDRLRAADPVENAPAVLLAACDPANPWGAALPWPPTQGHRPSRRAGALVSLVNGHPILYLERGARTLITFDASSGASPVTEDALGLALTAVADAVQERRLEELTIERCNGEPVLGDHTWRERLEQVGFSMTPRGFRLRRRHSPETGRS